MRLEAAMLAFLMLLLLPCRPAMAEDATAHCTGRPSISETELVRASCGTEDGMAIERYFGPTPSSPYATAFDRREVLVAHGAEQGGKQGSNPIGSHPVRLPTRWLAPPMEDRISRQSEAGAARSHGRWRISTSTVEYGTQGGLPGFFLSCATATRPAGKKTSATKAVTIVAECFAPEERQRFYRTLDSTR